MSPAYSAGTLEQDRLDSHTWTRDGRHLVTAYTKYLTSCVGLARPLRGELRVFDLLGQEMAHIPYSPDEGGNDLSLTPDGKAVTIALRNRVGFFNPETLADLGTVPARARLWRSLGTDYGVSFGEDGLELWDLRRLVPIQRLKQFCLSRDYRSPAPALLPVYEMEVSRDGLLAVRTRDRNLLYRLKR